jgi:4a-hydroxytetrahydrobiopterin dehydratase
MAILTEEEVRAALAGRHGWRRAGDALVRERGFRDFGEALAFVERVGEVAQDYGRHPEISIDGGNRVRVRVANPNGAGFTDAELRLVEKVDDVADAPEPAAADPPQRETPVAAVAAVAKTVVDKPAAVAKTLAEAPAAAVDAASEPEPERGGRVAVVVAGVGGLAVGAAVGAVAARRL